MSTGRVVCAGVLILDVLGRPVETIPSEQNSEFLDEITASVGGTAGVTAATLARLGVPTSVGGAVGQDALGNLLVSRLESFGVAVTAVRRLSDAPTSASILPIRPNGDRPALHVPGASRHVLRSDLERPVDADVTWFHLAGALRLPQVDGDVAGELLSELRQRGITTSCDVLGTRTPDSARLMAPVLKELDYFLPNLAEGRVITGEHEPDRVAAALVEAGVGCVVLKLGSDGCRVRTRDERFAVPAVPATVVDTTGCGDSFSAGFIAARLEGKDIRAAAAYGSATASLVIERLGGDTAPVSRELVEKRVVVDVLDR
jgi:sugar/nucleoside kinase (ribokinase family)